jgi:hypothetical protein
MDKTTRLFMHYIQYESPLTNGVISIDIESFYAVLNPIFNPPKGVYKDKTIWTRFRIHIIDAGSVYNGNAVYFCALLELYKDGMCIVTSTHLKHKCHLPRIGIQGVPLTALYGYEYTYKGFVVFSNITIMDMYNSSVPTDINFAKNNNLFSKYHMMFIHKDSFYITISRNMLIRELTKCEYVTCTLYQSIKESSLYIIRFMSDYEGYILGTDAKVFGVSLN